MGEMAGVSSCGGVWEFRSEHPPASKSYVESILRVEIGESKSYVEAGFGGGDHHRAATVAGGGVWLVMVFVFVYMCEFGV